MGKANSGRKISAIIISLVIVGCQKDYSTSIDTTVEQVALLKGGASENTHLKKVRIKKTNQQTSSPFSPIRTGVFEYNKWGDPVSIMYNINSSEQYYTNWKFIYNNKHQLSQSLQHYELGYFTWSTYVYNNKGQIIRDTSYHFGILQNGTTPLHSNMKSVSHYTYDNEGRVSFIRFCYSSSCLDQYYNYDSRGNLIKENAIYDNKVNPQRLHDVFMFVARDYSKNNALPASSYNSYGLPLRFNSPGVTATFLGTNMSKSEIEYESK